jgi:DNA repair exonuclease SbcCD nuclease subunit
LKPDNIELKKNVVSQQCQLAKKLGVPLVCAGDVFESRKAQELTVLKGFSDILDTVHGYGLKLHLIAGNHDKTSYSSDDSFIEPFKHHPALLYYSKQEVVWFGKTSVAFVPFYQDDVYIERLAQVDTAVICVSHTAVNGSVNNDGSKVEGGLSAKLFAGFKLVILGHYHNASQPAHNIYHTPSLNQSSFGEDTDKGFTIVFDDLTMERVQPQAPSYVTVKIDMDTTTKKELDSLVKSYADNLHTSGGNVKFVLTGDETAVKSVNKNKIQELGIKVDVKATENESEETEYVEDVSELTEVSKTSIKDEFPLFCEQYGIKDVDAGMKFLTKKLG